MFQTVSTKSEAAILFQLQLLAHTLRERKTSLDQHLGSGDLSSVSLRTIDSAASGIAAAASQLNVVLSLAREIPSDLVDLALTDSGVIFTVES